MIRKSKRPQRVPHPDPAVEARLQGILSLYAAVARAGQRLEDITAEQAATDAKARTWAEENKVVKNLEAQSARLRAERAELETFIAGAHEDITAILVSLGNDALYLGPVP